MKYIAEFETNIGTIRAEWHGNEDIDLYPESTGSPKTTISVWDYDNDKPLIEQTGKALAVFTREWLWETERGIEFESISYSESGSLNESE